MGSLAFLFDHKCVFTFKKKDGLDMEELILDLIDYDVEDEYEEDDEEGTITIYGNPKSYAAIQKHLEECGFEDVGGDFTYIPNDMKEVTPEQRETLDKMIERLCSRKRENKTRLWNMCIEPRELVAPTSN